jgi:hypothetical protein
LDKRYEELEKLQVQLEEIHAKIEVSFYTTQVQNRGTENLCYTFIWERDEMYLLIEKVNKDIENIKKRIVEIETQLK